jgi:hypothetical protein
MTLSAQDEWTVRDLATRSIAGGVDLPATITMHKKAIAQAERELASKSGLQRAIDMRRLSVELLERALQEQGGAA